MPFLPFPPPIPAEQPWHLDVFKCTSEYPCYPKSFLFPGNQPLNLLTCTEVSFLRLATRGQQRPAFGKHSVLVAWPKILFAFYHQMPWQRQFSFSPKQRDWTTNRQHCHHFVPLPSATFQATSPFHHPTTLSSFRPGNSSKCLLQSCREWKFRSNKRNLQRPN